MRIRCDARLTRPQAVPAMARPPVGRNEVHLRSRFLNPYSGRHETGSGYSFGLRGL